jgi:hypothetical protein
MKDIREIYQALLDGKKIRNTNSGRIYSIKDAPNLNFSILDQWEIYKSKWEMTPARWVIGNRGNIFEGFGEVTEAQRFGMKYHTKEQAQTARDQLKRANLLRYWVSTMQDLDEGGYTIYKHPTVGGYQYCEDTYTNIGAVTMKKEAAIKICDALNSGDLELC